MAASGMYTQRGTLFERVNEVDMEVDVDMRLSSKVNMKVNSKT